VDFVTAATNRSWTRDFLPLGVVRRRRGRRELAAVKWRFDGWARYPNHAADEAAGHRIARRLKVPVFFPEAAGRCLVLEGGAIDVDGQGTLLATEQCLLTGRQARNRALGKAGTEVALRDYLGAERVIWLGNGIAGDDTGGHVDDFARFVASGVVALAEEKHRSDPNYRPLHEARERLSGARDARGRRLEVVRLPMPRPVLFAGERLPASYANFYIGTGAVLVPTFNDPSDRVALGILAELFPKRTVVGIHSTDFVLGLGTIHCSTQQEPLV
jgi:agmatine deiminase